MTTATRSTNTPRGIPEAVFIDNVEEHIGGPNSDAQPAMESLQEMINKYRFMESSLLTRRKTLEGKVPELQRTLEVIGVLKEKNASPEEFKSTFELNDTLYATATIDKSEQVYLWLGANTMLAYSLDEAEELLQNKRDTAEASLASIKNDLGFLREQITTTEVNMARVYNFDVKRRKDVKGK